MTLAAAATGTLRQEFGADADVTFVRMDLAELATVREAATEVLRTVPQVDALICNAAIAQVPTQQFTVIIAPIPLTARASWLR